MAKIHLDKYYTDVNLARYCIEKTKEIIGEDNITEYLEPSAGNGSFSLQINNCVAYDLEPEHESIIKQNFLGLDLPYKKGRAVIGNPPFGDRMKLAKDFFKKSTSLSDYICFILPISQLNNSQSLFEFDLIYSEDLGVKKCSNVNLHCCFNIYKRPTDGLNKRKNLKLKDIEIVRQDSKRYNNIVEDVRMCYWGNGSAGKILTNVEDRYAGEYKIIIHNKEHFDEIKSFILNYDWVNETQNIAMKRIKQYHIVEVLKNNLTFLK